MIQNTRGAAIAFLPARGSRNSSHKLPPVHDWGSATLARCSLSNESVAAWPRLRLCAAAGRAYLCKLFSVILPRVQRKVSKGSR